MICSLRLLSVSALLLLTSGPVDDVGFHADEGTTVTRTFDYELEMSLDTLIITVNGEDLPAENFEGVEVDLTDTYHVVVTDVFGEPGDGRPASLRRSFEELSGQSAESSSGPGGDEESNQDKSSDLEGSAVVFTWDEEEEAYGVEFEDGGDEELLEDLAEDMDLRGFLPDGDVDEGDSWEPDIEAFRSLLEAGGDLHLDTEDEESSDLDEELSDNLDGEVRVTYTGTREEGGVEVALLEVEIDASSDGTGTEESPMGGEMQSTLTMDFTLEGELLWNVTSGHLHSVEIAGEVETMIQNVSEFEGNGESMEVIQQMEFLGNVTFTVAVEGA